VMMLICADDAPSESQNTQFVEAKQNVNFINADRLDLTGSA